MLSEGYHAIRLTLRLQLIELLVEELEVRLGEVDVGKAAILRGSTGVARLDVVLRGRPLQGR